MGILFGGPTPEDGQSAYEEAVENGFVGTEAQWLASLHGATGASAYQIWLAAGNTGTVAQFLASIQGPMGPQGPVGPQGPSGVGGGGGLAIAAPSPWIINGTGSSNVNQCSGLYMRIGQLVIVHGKFNATSALSTISLPYPASYLITAMPVGFTPQNVTNERGVLSVGPTSMSNAFILLFNTTGPISLPKTIGLSFSYICT